jgi:outer membrane receptor for ferrienterochelin and colicins
MTGWSFQRSRLNEPEPNFGSKDLFRSPNIYGYVNLNYENQRFLNLDFSLEYTGRMKIPHYAGYISENHLETSAPFWVLNARAKKPLSLNGKGSVDLILGAYNLFNSYQKDLDIGLYRDAGYIYGPSKPRSAYIGLEFKF